MKKLKICLKLFLTMFKIGLFTFGGGYAMVVLIENEFVEKKKWLTQEEYYDMLAIAESTPGPIAINSSTYIGYKLAGFWGALFATIAVCVPSYIIICLISTFLDKFLQYTIVANAFKGIQVCVAYLILSAGIKMIKKLPKTIVNITLLSLTAIALIVFTLLSVSFSSIFYILIGGAVGLMVYFITIIKSKKSADKKGDNE